MTLDSRACFRIGEGQLNPSQCGAKAFRQHELKRLGFLVPDGLILTYDQVDHWAAACQLSQRDTYATALKRIRGADQGNDFLAAVLSALPGKGPLILRTAAAKEDRPDGTMAGQFVSRPGIHTTEDLQEALAAAWAAAASRSSAPLRLSFLVQEYIQTEYGGVAFTVSPTAPKASEIILEVIEGSCAQLTGGASPDARLTFDWRNQTLDKPFPGHLSRLVSNDQITQLGNTFLDLQKHFGCPQDIEWGVCEGVLYIFQSRPITRIAFSADTIWTNANFRDGGIGADMPSPLMWSLYQMTFDQSIDAFSKRYHITPDTPPKAWSRTFLGYPYWNLAATKSGARKVLGYVERQFDQGQGVTPYYEGDGEVSKLTPRRLFTSLKALLAIRKSIKSRFKVCQQTKAYFEKIASTELVTPPDEQSATADLVLYFERLVTQHLMYIYTRYWEIIYDNTFVSTFTQQALDRYNRKTGSNLEFPAVTANLENVAHLRPLEALLELGQGILSDDAAHAWWTAHSVEEIFETWYNGSPFPFQDQLKDYLTDYGYKSSRELEIQAPNWSEDPTPVFHVLRQFLAGAFSASAKPHTPWHSDRSLPHKFKRQIEQQRKLLWWKEEIRDITTQLFHYIRKSVIALGQRLEKEGILPNAEDAFFLTHQELICLGKMGTVTADYRERIVYRRNLQASFRNFQKPDLIFPDPAEHRTTTVGYSGLKGIGVCHGKVEGVAVTVSEINDYFDPSTLDGRILVTPYINPGHLPYFSNLKGLITENGGLLSHAAIICRELNIPAIFGVPDATHKLRDNPRIRLNGKTGEVAILAE
jgi:pyruvate,water dikinase